MGLTQDKIAKVAMDACHGKISGFPTQPGYCLGFAFEVIARATNTNRWSLYEKILDKAGTDPDHRRWALDAEEAFERLGWDKLVREEVDAEDKKLASKLYGIGPCILFSRVSGDIEGHVGIYLGNGFVAENTRARRGFKGFKGAGALRITPLHQWNDVTTIGVIPDGWPNRD
jgi:hypothetical protein